MTKTTHIRDNFPKWHVLRLAAVYQNMGKHFYERSWQYRNLGKVKDAINYMNRANLHYRNARILMGIEDDT